MGINTENARPSPDQPLYVWHGTGDQVSWPALLRLWGSEAARLQPGPTGLWICDRLLAFATEAVENQITTPDQHATYQADTLAAASAYLAQLECDAFWDPGPEPEDDPCDPCFGSLLGHPAGEDGFPLQVWLGDQSCDDTYAN